MPLAPWRREGKSTADRPCLSGSASRETCQRMRQRADGVFRDWLWERAPALSLLARPRSLRQRTRADG